MIDLITVVGGETDGHDRGHKYPYVAAEIMSKDINQILDFFFTAPLSPEADDEATLVETPESTGDQYPLLEKLFGFLKTDE